MAPAVHAHFIICYVELQPTGRYSRINMFLSVHYEQRKPLLPWFYLDVVGGTF